MLIIGLVNIKGGAGKTHATVHLANEARRQQRVAIIDLDPTHQSMNWVQGAQIPVDAVHLDLKQTDLEAYLEQVRAAGEHDVVLIDTPANDMSAAMETLMVADVVAVPIGVGTSDIGMLATTRRLIQRASQTRTANGLRPLTVRALINRAGFAPKRTENTVATVQEYGLTPFRQRIPMLGAYQDAAGERITSDQYHYGEILKEIRHGLA